MHRRAIFIRPRERFGSWFPIVLLARSAGVAPHRGRPRDGKKQEERLMSMEVLRFVTIHGNPVFFGGRLIGRHSTA